MDEFVKKNFAADDRVKFINTGSDIDGAKGTILGKSIINVIDCYIVLFDVLYAGQKACTMIESCLEGLSIKAKGEHP
ncbi:MAG: hypothetical protein ACRDE2_12625 [Chitinophagaceae bacterium]